jgi:UDP-N-acetylmuramyl pentapeptide phosphotransferase/UDP-N-acetylglucosamine-1-phosphate transferase
MFYLLIFTLNIILTFFTLKIFIYYSNSLKIIDTPKNLAVHKIPTATACGIIFCLVFLLNFFIIHSINMPKYYFLNKEYIFYICLIILTTISFIDDVNSIHPIYRLLVQTITVMFSIPLLYPSLNIFLNFIPQKLLIFAIIFYWIYLINISNFLDGSDGYLAINAIAFFISILLLTILKDELIFLQYISFFMIPILLTFLYFNKSPAKIFMGDSGSIFIGYLFGLCSLQIIINNYWYVALTILAYPFMDVSLTILRKIKNKKKPWDRLFDYFFLRALISSNYNHKKILNITIIYNVFIIFLVFLQILFNIKYLFVLAFLASIIKIKKFSLMAS